MMAKRTLWARVQRVWITTGLLATVGFFAWSYLAYRATPEARAALRTDSRVKVDVVNGIRMFTPAAQSAAVPVGLMFFAGSMVEPEAYAPLAQAVALAGYPVILVPLPKRGMFGGADDPNLVHNAVNAMHEDMRATRWVLGGHSRGAVVATKIVAQLTAMGGGAVAGLVLVGTTHPRDVDLSALKVPVTKIVGTKDGVAPLAKSEANRALLPPTTTWVRIEGGNHSQFGWYGFQPFDHFASISRAEQQRQMITGIVNALREAGEKKTPGVMRPGVPRTEGTPL
ncbi:MAG: hypothetical protein IT353_00180 [Gemmatimonadaceae bacterium]|nr:hypothetical protein [Gemmatimonadaceae bacterium]